jgi:hypothetical protein
MSQLRHQCGTRLLRTDKDQRGKQAYPATSTVKVIHAAPCDLTDGRYDHTTPLEKLI